MDTPLPQNQEETPSNIPILHDLDKVSFTSKFNLDKCFWIHFHTQSCSFIFILITQMHITNHIQKYIPLLLYTIYYRFIYYTFIYASIWKKTNPKQLPCLQELLLGNDDNPCCVFCGQPAVVRQRKKYDTINELILFIEDLLGFIDLTDITPETWGWKLQQNDELGSGSWIAGSAIMWQILYSCVDGNKSSGAAAVRGVGGMTSCCCCYYCCLLCVSLHICVYMHAWVCVCIHSQLLLQLLLLLPLCCYKCIYVYM